MFMLFHAWWKVSTPFDDTTIDMVLAFVSSSANDIFDMVNNFSHTGYMGHVKAPRRGKLG